MASKPTKKELLGKLEAMGVEASAKMTVAELQELAEKAENAPSGTVKTVKSTGFDALNVRLGPSKSAPVVAELENGEEAVVLSVDGQWARLENGYCMAKYLV